ncbi:protein-disulfide isomerase [Murinocardiopsis flavida]|uniref:Protein-disulfide isomerase n=1 Tax=Murinocardiopsis flavida TaxID=645275 RepID=A0A2P8DTP3_9ACTN|nr:DsbA family protein [Murinocardiopsis flavida]PSL00587.1 protein-disulfide isomerase [Murinocardiopsis flavida]
MSPRPKQSGVLPLALGGVLLLILVAALYGATRDTGAADGTDPVPQSAGVGAETRELGESLARRTPGDPMALGDPGAPVVLIAYSDYRCPFCATWVRDTQPELVEDYVENGELRIEWREFPYLGAESRTLAIGARAAAEQDGFWDFHAAVYAAQRDVKDAGPDLPERMARIADKAGLDADRFTEDLADEELAADVDADFAEGQRIGVSGTPAFLVNGDPVMGAQPLGEFTAAIDRALAAAEG